MLVLDGNQATLTTPGAAPQVFDLDKDATMRAIFDQLLTWLGPGSLAAARDDYDLSTGGTRRGADADADAEADERRSPRRSRASSCASTARRG